MSGLARASLSLGKPDALARMAQQAGVPGALSGDPWHVAEAVARLPVLGNAHVQLRPAAESPSAVPRLLQPARQRAIPRPVFTNGRPPCFPKDAGVEQSPAFEVLELEGGFVAQIARAPAVLACDGATLVADYSSPYAGLVHSYDIDLGTVLGAAYRVDGTAVVLCDDIHPLNFSHWMLDELPRLAMLGEQRDAVVVTSEEDRRFKRESLRLCGFADRQIVYLRDFAAVQADRLLVPRDIAVMPHPAFKAAPWVLNFLRGRVGLPAVAQQPAAADGGEKLFVSRDDGEGRRIVNEAELMRAVEPLGYRRVTLAGRSLAEQVALFARATHVLGAHGAGLTNCAFSPLGARLLEIFPLTYGTPAYYVLTAGQGNGYATYVARDIVGGSRAQTDDIRLDVADFMRCCAALL